MLTFLLLTVYLLLIQHYVFKGCMENNVLNLGYGRGGRSWVKSRYILVWEGDKSYSWWFTRDPKCHFNWIEFLFGFKEGFIAPSLWNNYFWLWDDSFGGEKESEVGIKSTSFLKILWKVKEHLLFGCSGVCVIV